MDIRQSPQYAAYMRSIGWSVVKAGKWNAFVKTFPFFGSFIKIQRINRQIPWRDIQVLQRKYRAHRTIVEFDKNIQSKLPITLYQLQKSPFSPTKTIHIDLRVPLDTLFKSFNSSTRRAIRKAEGSVVVKKSDDIDTFIRLKSRNIVDYFLLKSQTRALWQSFRPRQAILLLAYSTISSKIPNKKASLTRHFDTIYHRSSVVSGILILYSGDTAYYWIAASTRIGNSLRAPSLLVWNALQYSKKRGIKTFDFEGIYDSRFPEAFKKWKGFSRFKKGFGGKEIAYPAPIRL